MISSLDYNIWHKCIYGPFHPNLLSLVLLPTVRKSDTGFLSQLIVSILLKKLFLTIPPSGCVLHWFIFTPVFWLSARVFLLPKACRDFLDLAETHSRRWQRALQYEREQRTHLEETIEQLAKQHNSLERAWREAPTLVSSAPSAPTTKGETGCLLVAPVDLSMGLIPIAKNHT